MFNKSKYTLKIYFCKPGKDKTIPEKRPAYKVDCENTKVVDELYEVVKRDGLVKFYNIIFDSSRFCSAELKENR